MLLLEVIESKADKTTPYKLRLIPETVEYLLGAQPDRFIAPVTICGPYRSGKSFLLNQLLSRTNEGFNVGSTVHRAVPERRSKPRKHVFESPLVRLASDHGYTDVYEDGYDIVDPEWETTADGKPTGNVLTGQSIIIFRYYDSASTLLGDGKTPDIEDFAMREGVAPQHRTTDECERRRATANATDRRRADCARRHDRCASPLGSRRAV